MADDRHRRVITSAPRLSRDEIANHAFPSAFRGYAESEVRAFLRRLADEFEALRARNTELAERLRGLEARGPERPVAADQDLIAAVGEETARVLRAAQEAADEIRHSAEGRAAQHLAETHEEARRVRDEAERVVAERSRAAEETYAEMVREAERLSREVQESAAAGARQLEEEADRQSQALLDDARKRSNEMLAEAEAARDRMLQELGRRRAVLEAQLDSLRTGRDRLLESYRVVKRTFDEATAALRHVDARPSAPARAEAPPEAPEGPVEAGPATQGAPAEAPVARGVALGELEAGDKRGPGEAVRVIGPAAARPREDEPEAPEAEVEAETAPGPPAATTDDVEAETAPGPPAATTDDVDALFARLRSEAAAKGALAAPVEAAAAGTDGEAREGGAAPAAGVLAKREACTVEMRDDLVHIVKRIVRDEENEVLAALRELRTGTPSSEELLPSVGELEDAFAAGLAAELAVAAEAGGRAGVESGLVPGPAPDDVGSMARDVAAALASELLGSVHARLAATLRESADGGADELSERVRSQYRQLRSARIEDGVGEALSWAFARGLYEATPAGVPLRWIVDDVRPCPDCDDNALEVTPRGQPFPTGHLCPPAHPGCRCLVVPAAPGPGAF